MNGGVTGVTEEWLALVAVRQMIIDELLDLGREKVGVVAVTHFGVGDLTAVVGSLGVLLEGTIIVTAREVQVTSRVIHLLGDVLHHG